MKTELLAPAGSYQAMTAAFAAGADAVYIGGEKFGARAHADNLNQEQMCEAIDYAHLHGKKLYLTVNTLLKEEELELELYEYLKPFYEHGLDAVIVQDIGALQLIRSYFPSLPIHASTQMTLTGQYSAQMLEAEGITRLVTPRELSCREIKKIRETTKLEIESFVHGALCYSFSGQCLFSSLLGGRSGNRGRCAQPCRLPYGVQEQGKQLNTEKEQYPLSPKDMCTIEILPEIIRAGVTSLKIEGRMKKPEYTAGVVQIYRKYLDILEDNKKDYKVSLADLQQLMKLYNRDGFNQSYYKCRNGRDMLAIRNEKKTSSGRDIAKTRDEKLFERLREQFIESDQRIAIEGSVVIHKNEPASIEVAGLGISLTHTVGKVEGARSQPLSEERIHTQMMKTGNTPFYFANLRVCADDDIFVPMQLLNELRRDALILFREKVIGCFRRNDTFPYTKFEKQVQMPGANVPVLTAYADTREQLDVLCDARGIERIYANCSIFWGNKFEAQVLLWIAQMRKVGKKPYLSLPYIIREGELDGVKDSFVRLKEQGLAGFLVHDIEGVSLLSSLSLKEAIVLDYQVYTLNRRSQEFWQDKGILYDTISPELNYREIIKRNNCNSEMLIYGYALMMISAQCVKKNVHQCDKHFSTVQLTDRYQKKFKVKCECNFCYNIIYNSIPYGLIKESKEVKALNCQSLRLSFSVENAQEVKAIIKLFCDVYVDGGSFISEQTFTKGHFKRGVE